MISASTIEGDLTKERPQWILSAYGPGRDAPAQLFGGNPREISFEELRVDHYLAAAQGKPQEAVQRAMALVNQAEQQIQTTLNNLDGAVSYIQAEEKNHPNRIDICRAKENFKDLQGHPNGTSGALVGGGENKSLLSGALNQTPAPGGIPFGQTQQLGQRASPFGQPSQLGSTSTPFGQPSQLGQASGPFGQPSQLGQRPNPFGQPSQPGPFGQPSQMGQSTAPFGQTPQLGQGGPGGFNSSQPAPFGQPAASQTPFGQPPQPKNPFNIQAPLSASPVAFNQPSHAPNPLAPSTNPNPFSQQGAPAAAPNPFSNSSPFGQQSSGNNQSIQNGNPDPFPVNPPNPYAPDAQLTHPDLRTYSVRDKDNKLKSWKGKAVAYIDQEPYYQREDDGKPERIWNPNGPPMYYPATELPADQYDQDTKERYLFMREHGSFKDGLMPLKPPRREWCLWDF
ncbi:MAG: hypothetical protein M1824_000186 [Vezdaea acicularis]|nr:MAG: hypothetical protein M1824_000186 [Vezdaea acicularis]